MDVGENQLNAWSFEPIALDPVHLGTAPIVKIAPITRAVGSLATRLGAIEEGFRPTDENGYRRRSILLHTPNGPVHYYRVTNDYYDNGRLAVEYPKSVGEIPEDIIASTLDVEPSELHNDFPHGGAKKKSRHLIAQWRFPDTDAEGKHTWIEQRDGTIVHYGGLYLQDTAVINGILGEVQVHEMHSVSVEEGSYLGYVEEEPHKIDVATVHKLEDRFKKLALAVAKHMGGTNQLSAITHESKPGLLSYHAMGTNHNQSAAFVLPKLAILGYDVRGYQRTPSDNVDPGYKVLIATKATPRGTETLALYEGLSTFYYTRGSRQWRITRGLVLKGPVEIEDFDKVLEPVRKVKESSRTRKV